MHWRVLGPECVWTEGHGGSVNPPRYPCRASANAAMVIDPERIVITPPIGMPRGHFRVAALQRVAMRPPPRALRNWRRFIPWIPSQLDEPRAGEQVSVPAAGRAA